MTVELCTVHLTWFIVAIVPTIWGDGTHDDTDGFEALVCQQEFAYAPGTLKVTYDTTGRQHIDVSRERRFLLPHGIPMPRHTEHGVSIYTGSNAPEQQYEIDCAARNIS